MQFDEPLGHNDGTVKGVKIFDCAEGYGAFVRGNKVAVGDFPEVDLFGSDDEGCGDDCAAKCKADSQQDDDDEI